jgi:hypothetical protein
LVRKSISEGENVDKLDVMRKTPLHFAVQRRQKYDY